MKTTVLDDDQQKTYALTVNKGNAVTLLSSQFTVRRPVLIQSIHDDFR